MEKIEQNYMIHLINYLKFIKNALENYTKLFIVKDTRLEK